MLVFGGFVAAVSLASLEVLGRDDPARDPRGEPVGPRTGRLPHRPQFVSLAWVGDISLSSSYGLPPDPDRSLFAGVKQHLAASDITIGNLEGTLGSGGGSKCAADMDNCFAFQAPPGYARLLKRAGFDLMNLANNHAFDFGATGQRETGAALRRAGLDHVGRPGEVLVSRSRGLRIAAVGFAPYPWANSIRELGGAQRLVRRAERKADVVVVIMHAGAEGSDRTHTPRGTEFAFGENRGNTRRFAHAVVRAGADLVLGSGPHVVRGIERYRGRLIAYSLGNFLGYHTFSTAGALSNSGILRVRLARSGRALGGRWISVRLNPAGIPHLDRAREAARLVRDLSRQDFGRRAYPMESSGVLRPAR